MSDSCTYYTVCLIYLAAVVFSAICIDDLSFIFGVIAAFSESTLNFILPALLMLVTGRKNAPLFNTLTALFAVTGMWYFSVSNYFNWAKLMRSSD